MAHTVAFYVDLTQESARRVATEATSGARDAGYSVALCEDQDAMLHLADKGTHVEDADYMVAIGGDGTLLRAARIAYPHDIPLLGINTGRLGFLTELELDGDGRMRTDLKRVLEDKSDLVIEERAALEAQLPDGKTHVALNDVVVHKGDASRIDTFSLSLDGEHVADLPSDGVVVATRDRFDGVLPFGRRPDHLTERRCIRNRGALAAHAVRASADRADGFDDRDLRRLGESSRQSRSRRRDGRESLAARSCHHSPRSETVSFRASRTASLLFTTRTKAALGRVDSRNIALMALRRLIVEDYELIAHAELEPAAGLTAITGETGSGKTMLLDAIDFALGARAATDAVRKGRKRARISLEIEPDARALAAIAAAGIEIDEDETLAIVRELSDGKTSARVGGVPGKRGAAACDRPGSCGDRRSARSAASARARATA